MDENVTTIHLLHHLLVLKKFIFHLKESLQKFKVYLEI